MDPCPLCSELVNLEGEICAHCGASLHLLGEYKIASYHGFGRGGHLYEAIDSRGSRVAIKVYGAELLDWASDEEVQRGVARLRGLRHPRIARVLAFKGDSYGRSYLIQPWLDGGSLADRIRNGQHASPAQFEGFVRSSLQILRYLHELIPPLVVCDLQPDSFSFQARDRWDPILTELVGSVSVTKDDPIAVGSDRYGAPELLENRADQRGDLYSLALIALEIATQIPADELPREANGGLLDGPHLHIAEPLKTVLMDMGHLDPASRPKSAKVALDRLDNALTKTTSKVRRLPRWVSAAIVLGFAMLTLLGVNIGIGAIEESLQAGSSCSQQHLSLEPQDDQFCVYWSDNRVLLGCAKKKQDAELFCEVVDAIPKSKPQKLNERAAKTMVEEAKEHDLAHPISMDALAPFVEQNARPENVREAYPEAPASTQAQQETAPSAAVSEKVSTVTIDFETSPAEASITVNNKRCQTPCQLSLPKGEVFWVRAHKEGYQVAKAKLRTYSNKTISLTLTPGTAVPKVEERPKEVPQRRTNF